MPVRKIYKGLSAAERDIIKKQAWDNVSGGESLKKAKRSKRSSQSKQKLRAYEAEKRSLATEKRDEHQADKVAVEQQRKADADAEAFHRMNFLPRSGVLPCQQGQLTDPCYLDKLIVRTVRASPRSTPTPRPVEDTDPAVLDNQALQLQSDIVENQDALDNAMTSGTSAMNEAHVAELKVRREALEDALLDLTLRRSLAGTPPRVRWSPPVDRREFTIVENPPDPAQVEQPLAVPCAELETLTESWHETHDAHEAAKKELQAYTKKMEKLAKAKASARMKLEQAKRALKAKELALLGQMEADLDAARTEAQRLEALRKIKKFRDRDTRRLQKTDKAHTAAEEKFNAARAEHRDFATGAEYTDLKRREEHLRSRLRRLTDQTDAKVDEITAIEKSILADRNTLASGSEIEVTAGSEKRYIAWLSDDDGSLVDETPELEIELRGGRACSGDSPKSYRIRSGAHPHLVCTERGGEKPVLSAAGSESLPKFKVYQVRQWDDKLGQSRIPGVRQLQQAAQFFRAIAAVFGRRPGIRTYAIQASACGVKVVDPLEAGTDTLRTTLKVYPADRYAISITTPAAFGQTYTREMTITKADAPVAETGQLQYESSGSTIEISDKETTTHSQLGVVQSMQSTERMQGYDSSFSRDEDLVITKSAQREGGVFGTMRTATDATGEHHGEGYTGRLVTTNSYNWSGAAPTTVEELSESGSVADRRERLPNDGAGMPATGALLSVDDYREQDEQSGNVSAMNPGDTLKRVPALPGSFFPQIPVEISFTRNDREDEFTANIKAAVGTTIWLTRQLGVFIGRIGNVVPSMGYKFGFSVDFLNGKLLYQRQWRDHYDRRVWLHQKGQIDIKIVTAKVFVFVGISVSVVILEFELGIEVHIKGSIGIQGSVENQHPDAGGGKRVGIGPTGSIGCGAEVRLVIGQADWCKASGDIATRVGVAATWWLAHEEGPHADLKIGFEGVKAKLVFHLVLVGHFEKGHTFCKERELWSGRYPQAFDEQRLNTQTAAMEKERAAAALEAKKLQRRIDRRNAKAAPN